jgi:hypothetical protein
MNLRATEWLQLEGGSGPGTPGTTSSLRGAVLLKKLHFKATFFIYIKSVKKSRIKRDEANLSGIFFVKILVRV